MLSFLVCPKSNKFPRYFYLSSVASPSNRTSLIYETFGSFSLQNHSSRCLYFLSLPPNRFDIVDKSNAKPNKKRISFQFQDAISFVIDEEGTSRGKHSRVSYNPTIRIVENSRFQRDFKIHRLSPPTK